MLAAKSCQNNWHTDIEFREQPTAEQPYHSSQCRPSVYLPSGWVFVIVCTMLRFTQGIGSAFFYTTAYAMVAKLYPDSIGFVIVSSVMSCIESE